MFNFVNFYSPACLYIFGFSAIYKFEHCWSQRGVCLFTLRLSCLAFSVEDIACHNLQLIAIGKVVQVSSFKCGDHGFHGRESRHSKYTPVYSAAVEGVYPQCLT